MEVDWAELEVGKGYLAESHPPWGGRVGLDVCVLPASFPTCSLTETDSIGWRVEVTNKRGSQSKGTQQIEVSGAWFWFTDRSRILPIQLEEDKDESESDEGDEGDEGDEEDVWEE